MSRLSRALGLAFKPIAKVWDITIGQAIKPHIILDFLGLGVPDEKATEEQIKKFTDDILKGETPMAKEWREGQGGTFGIDGGIVAFMLPIMMGTVYPFLYNAIQQTGIYKQNRFLHGYRLRPSEVVQLWLRGFPNKEESSQWFSDLRDQGWSEKKLDALRELAMILPTPQELVLWQAREVFEPDAIKRYGLEDEFEKLDLSLFEKIGVSREMAKNHWKAHWQHASWTQVIEMLHRGLMTEPDVWEWFRLVEIPPFWRQKLIDMSWDIPTRVDIRRWWDMRTITEEDLRSLYTKLGYHGRDLEDYILWTKVYTAFPDLVARYKNGWISSKDVEQELISLGMPSARAKELLETKIQAPVKTERVAKERDLTKAEIIKGVKKDKITVAQAIDLLIDWGLDEDEAAYVVDINVEAEGSPETYLDYKKLVQSYRRSQGMTTKEIPDVVVAAEKALKEIERKRSKAIEERASQSAIDRLEVERAEAAVKYRELLKFYKL